MSAVKKKQIKTPSRIKILRQMSPYKFEVEVRVMRNGVNENKWDFRNIEDYYGTFVGTPILIAYVKGSIGDGHNSETKIDFKTGERYQSYTSATAERPVGYISPYESDLHLVEEGGYTWLSAKGIIWSYYARELVEKIEKIGKMDVSAEINSIEEHVNNGITEITRWAGIGVTILGEHVAPAIPGSNIKKMAAYREQLNEMKRYVASLEARMGENEPQKNTDMTGVKNNMSENKTLAKMLAKKFPDFRVLSFNETGDRVCLMAKDDCEIFSYAFDEADKGEVIAEKIKPVTLSVAVDFGGDTLTLSAEKIYDEIAGRNRTLASRLAEKEKEAAELNEKINKMIETERTRRINASKEAAKRQLAEINENRDEEDRIDESCINEVVEAADKGEFADCESADGRWNGEEKACSAVRDIAMKKQIELDKEKLERRNNSISKNYVFEKLNGRSQGRENSLEALYNRLEKSNKGVTK